MTTRNSSPSTSAYGARITQTRAIALLFDCFGVYHVARLEAAQKRSQFAVVGVELSPRSLDYPWFHSEGVAHLVRCFPSNSTGRVTRAMRREALFRCLDEVDPDVVAVPGWSDASSLIALCWCASRSRPAIMMSDSTYIDARRIRVLEYIKSLILGDAASAFVSGTRSKEYLMKLGMRDSDIATGYDVVDNQHFMMGADAARANATEERKRLNLPSKYFLFVGRLVGKKNIASLIQAYSIYRRNIDAANALALVIAGDGSLRLSLEAEVYRLGLGTYVHFYGHADYNDLPSIYGLAKFFVLPSRVEQWGLVVNEAIACGLPVLVSNRSGASELVDDGQNGFTFNPYDVGELALKIQKLSDWELNRTFGQRSLEVARHWDLDRFATGLEKAARIALHSAKVPGIATRLVAGFLQRI